MRLTFVESKIFTDRVARMGLEPAVRELQAALLVTPDAGDLDPGTGGLRKLRMPNPSRGKGEAKWSAGALSLASARESHLSLVRVRKGRSFITQPGAEAGPGADYSSHQDGGWNGGRMKEELFAELLESVTQALDHAKGRRELRTTILPAPPAPMSAAGVRRVRKRLNASQAVFARYLNVSTKLVQAWESDRRHPDGPALILLRLGDRDLETFTATVFGAAKVATRPASKSRPSKGRSVARRRKSIAA